MSSTTRRAIGNFAVSASGVLILLFALVALDDRFREQLRIFADGRAGAAQLAGVGERVRDLTLVAAQVAREQSLEHAPLMIFTVAALVLVIFLLRL